MDENSEKDVITWKLLEQAKNYRIGDGNTRIILPGDPPPEEGELKEVVAAFGDSLLRIQNQLDVAAMTFALTGVRPPTDPKAEARKRSREDVGKKRRELRRRKR